MRVALGLGVPAAAIVALAGVAQPDRPFAPRAPAVASKTAHPLGVVSSKGRSDLVRLDADLRPVKNGRRVIVGHVDSWAFSPGLAKLVVASHREVRSSSGLAVTLRFVDVVAMKARGDLALGQGYASTLAWVAPERLVALESRCCPGAFDLRTIDPRARKVIGRRVVAGSVLDAEATATGLVALVAPPEGIGTARLVTFEGGAPRSVALDGVLAGRGPPNDSADDPKFPVREPGLAVDHDRQVAFVADPSGSVTEVDLRTLAVSTHRVAGSPSLLQRVSRWLQPTARAKGLDGPVRDAAWLGGSALVVTGRDEAFGKDATGTLRPTWQPAGLTLIDTQNWTSRTIDRGADRLVVTGGVVLATGSSMDGSRRTSAMGLAGYARDGARRFAILDGRSAWVVEAWNGRAYVSVEGSQAFKVVDAASGKVLAERKPPVAQVLSETASPFEG